MRKIHISEIISAIKNLCIDINYNLPKDVLSALKKSFSIETDEIALSTLKQIVHNATLASQLRIPLCQDTGLVEVFAQVGCGVFVYGGCLTEAINSGVEAAYREERFRMSVVADPFKRINTQSNSPVTINIEYIKGTRLILKVLLKGGGAENSSAMKFFPPDTDWKIIEDFIYETVREKSPYSCPPVIVSVAVGGSFSSAPIAAKKALFRKVGGSNPDSFYKDKEEKLLRRINSSNIGPMATGGKTTALAVFITSLPTHIAMLPCAVNIQCHSLRRGVVTV